MRLDYVLLIIVAAAALYWFAARHRGRAVIAALLVIVLISYWTLVPSGGVRDVVEESPQRNTSAATFARPVVQPSDGYVGSASCRTCHAHQHETWHNSYHRTMTQFASPSAVMGDFDGVINWNNREVELWRERDEFWVDLEMPAGAQEPGRARRFQRPIVMTTGSHHMQAYWYPLVEDSPFLGLLPFVWLRDEKQWIPRTSAFLRPEPTVTDETGRWSSECVRCHATHGRMNVQHLTEDNTYSFEDVDTRAAELGISCEACHGPGEKHVAHQSLSVSEQQAETEKVAATIIQPEKLSHELSSQVCGQCHGIFTTHNRKALATLLRNGWDYRPGDDLRASRLRFLNRCGPGATAKESEDFEHSFWSDGMVRVSGREYNGLTESACFKNGEMSCLSCHNMHQRKSDSRPSKDWADDQLSQEMRGNKACTQCHSQYEQETILVEHTHHLPGSSGSDCYNCHMPYTTYGLLKAIRSHTISSPNVASSLATGRPNACNQCHLDQTMAWSAKHLNVWHQQPEPKLTSQQQKIAAAVLWTLKGDAGQRALMAWTFGWAEAQEVSGTEWTIPYIAELLNDPYDAVRFIAYRSIRRLPELSVLQFDFLGDEVYRAETAHQIRNVWRQQSEPIENDPSEQLLMDRNRNLMTESIDQLLKERDLRTIFLWE